MPQSNLTREEFIESMKPILAECVDDTATFASKFIPDRFTRAFDPPYAEMFALLDDDTKRRVAIAAPRGIGKTTSCTIALPARKITFHDCKYVLIISCTHSKAAEDVDNLGSELTENPRIVKVFGQLKGPKWSLGTGRLTTSTNIHIQAKGAGQQIRGLLKENRPDLIIIDDLEDPEPFRIGDATEYLRKLKHWFYADLLNSIDIKKTRVIVIGTVLGENSLLSELLESPDWDSVRLELCDDNYETKFPSHMTTPEVKELADRLKRAGQLDLFFQEFRNLAIAGEDAVFKASMFKDHYYDTLEILKSPPLDRIVIVDPAKTVKIHSAYSAIVGIGFDHRKERIYFMDCVNKKLHPDEIYKEAWLMAVRLKTVNIGCEVTSLNEFISYPFNSFLKRKGFPDIVELKARGQKIDRIRALAPFYRQGLIWHNPLPEIHGALEAQLLAYPRSKFWDVMDAFAYCIEMFDLGDRFFVSQKHDSAAFEAELAMLEDFDAGMKPVNFRGAP